jgi:hypothetical protein
LTRILAEDLEDNQFSSLVEFMRSRSNGKFARHGKRIEVIGPTKKKIKFLLHKFLHANRLSEYGILDTTVAFEIVRIKPETGDKRMKKHAPLKHPVPYGPPIPPGAIRPRLRVEWQGKPPPKKTRYRKGHRNRMPQRPGV